MIDFDFNKKCYGCSACANTCPKKAIEMVDDKDGFLVPEIDKEKCVNCGFCDSVCPRISGTKNTENKPLKNMYIYKKTVDSKLKQSTSSGVAFELAKYIINQGGYACGCAWDNMEAKHIIADDINILERIKGTKYVQSDIQYVYRDIEYNLKNDKKVIFFGTACQIVGIKNYLRKDYSNMYYIQIICHGAPSPGVFKKYKEYMENKHKKKITDINFRYRGKGGWLTPNPKYYFEDGSSVNLISDPYVVGFGRGLFDRISCSSCEFKNNFDIADIIIGDAWGIGSKDFLKSKNRGASSIMINSDKGYNLFNNIKSMFNIKVVDFDNITKENPAIIKTYKLNSKRDEYINKALNNKVFPSNEILGNRHKLKEILYKVGLLSMVKKIRYIIKHR